MFGLLDPSKLYKCQNLFDIPKSRILKRVFKSCYEFEIVEIDVAPSSGFLVNSFDKHPSSDVLLDIPACPAQGFSVLGTVGRI